MSEHAALAPALAALARMDPHLAVAKAVVGDLPDRRRPAGLPTLMRIIVEQQLSVASANAIWGRVAGACDPFTADAFLAFGDAELRSFGLSRPKAMYCRALAQAVADGRLDLAAMDRLPDAEAIAALSAVKGVGRWTAEVYLLFALGRQDVWPAHDVALQSAVQWAKGLSARPTWRQMDAIAAAWSPYRGVAARLLWRYYGWSRAQARSRTVKANGAA